MNRDLVTRIADAVLYEGYILYPYRPSVKNHQRWTFGGLYPPGFDDASALRVECLVRGGPDTAVEATVRFLHLTDRTVAERGPSEAAPYRAVESLRVGDRVFQPWQEAEAREVATGEQTLGALVAEPCRKALAVPGRNWVEPIPGDGGAVAGVLVRTQLALEGEVVTAAEAVADGLYRLTLTAENRTPLEGATRDDALMRALVSAHVVLAARGGEFVSLTDPPDDCRDHAAACRNVGVWPVLVGEAGDRDAMLAAPIILPDHPQVAPESPGDLFDGTEIDEILTMRILTLTDEEKRLVTGIDDRARALLARSEGLSAAELGRLHGTLREVRRG